MFSVVPIVNQQGTTTSALAFRINPWRHYQGIFNRGRVGTTGETYAFNHTGRMISDSLFEDELISRGILDKEQSSMLNMLIRDPQIDLREAPLPTSFTVDDLPATHMAHRALNKEDGTNMRGYRNYLGATVIGAWIWDDKLKLGIAKEIHYDEAYATVNIALISLWGLCSLSILLIIGLFFNNLRRQKGPKARAQFIGKAG